MSLHLKKFLMTVTLVFTAAVAKVDATPLDLAILMDGSGSVGPSDWAAEKGFVADLIDLFRVEGSTRFSITRYAGTAWNDWSFGDDQTDNGLIQSQVNGLPHPSGWGYQDAGLLAAMADFDTHSLPERDKTILLITDGNPLSSHDPCALVTDLNSRSIRTLVIGVGSAWNPAHFECLTSDPLQEIISVGGFLSLDAAIDPVVEQLGFEFAPDLVDGRRYLVNSAGIPEPSSLLLFAAGLMGAGFWGRRANRPALRSAAS